MAEDESRETRYVARHQAEAAGTEVQKGIGAGVTAYAAPVAMALCPTAILGGPGHVDYVGNQQPLQVILEVLAGLRASGVACVAPEDDPGCAQGCTLTNGGDEIHLAKACEPAAIGGSCEDVDRERMVGVMGVSHAKGLLNSEADKVAAMGGGRKRLVQVNRREEGCALGPEPGQLIVPGDLNVRAAAGVGLPVLHIVVVVTVGEEVEAPEVPWPNCLDEAQGLQHELPGSKLKLVLRLLHHTVCRPVRVANSHQLAR